VAKRSLTAITINEILLNDVQEFIRINDLVRQGHEAGLQLKRMDGKPYKYCPITVIEPVNPMGDTLDFSRESIQRRLRHGEEVARATLSSYREPSTGRPPPLGWPEPRPPMHS
jgi:NTE family protein